MWTIVYSTTGGYIIYNSGWISQVSGNRSMDLQSDRDTLTEQSFTLIKHAVTAFSSKLCSYK